MIRILTLAALLFWLPAGASAQDYQTSLEAYWRVDYATALRVWRPLAELGRHAKAQYYLGAMYRHGRGVPQDHAEAVRWCRLTAEQGDANAQSELGFMYDYGKGVPEDGQEAVHWLRLAAEQADAYAQAYLGLKYSFGEGVPEDLVLAYMWSNLASAQGHPIAANHKATYSQWMTREQIAEAQRLSRECLARNYKGC